MCTWLCVLVYIAVCPCAHCCVSKCTWLCVHVYMAVYFSGHASTSVCLVAMCRWPGIDTYSLDSLIDQFLYLPIFTLTLFVKMVDQSAFVTITRHTVHLEGSAVTTVSRGDGRGRTVLSWSVTSQHVYGGVDVHLGDVRRRGPPRLPWPRMKGEKGVAILRKQSRYLTYDYVYASGYKIKSHVHMVTQEYMTHRHS
jgi:hypothetical protein